MLLPQNAQYHWITYLICSTTFCVDIHVVDTFQVDWLFWLFTNEMNEYNMVWDF